MDCSLDPEMISRLVLAVGASCCEYVVGEDAKGADEVGRCDPILWISRKLALVVSGEEGEGAAPADGVLA